jgi:hypothetical protein
MDRVDRIAAILVDSYTELFTRRACATAVINESPSIRAAGQRLQSMGLLSEYEDPYAVIRNVNLDLQRAVRCVRMMDGIKETARRIISVNFPQGPSVFEQVATVFERLPWLPDAAPCRRCASPSRA